MDGLGLPTAPTLAHSRLSRMRGIITALRIQPSITPLRLFVRENGGERIEALEIRVASQIPQERKADIRPIETLLVVCKSPETHYPVVLAMRPNFPITAHQGGSLVGEPPNLCLYAEQFEEQALVWNPTDFLARIVSWLQGTAAGTLHPDDQPAEPFFFTTDNYIILPSDLRLDLDPEHHWITGSLIPPTGDPDPTGGTILLQEMSVAEVTPFRQRTGVGVFSVLGVLTPPVEHGIVHNIPSTLGELEAVLRPVGVELIPMLRDHIAKCYRSGAWSERDALLIVVRVPLLKHGKLGGISTAAFLLDKNIAEVGLAIDVLTRAVGRIAVWQPLAGAVQENRAQDFNISYSSCLTDVDATEATRGSGADPSLSLRTAVLAGEGALGSGVFENLHRSGLCRWVLVEKDIVLPHNLIRHTATRHDVGLNKAFAMARKHNCLWRQTDIAVIAKSVKNALNDENDRKRIESADYIIDCTASPAASRALVLDYFGKARRICCFATPNASDSVMLAEGVGRLPQLDSIEAQYYRFLGDTLIGDMHRSLPEGQYRYGLGCRDRTTILAPEQMALHGALITDEIKSALRQPEPRAVIWSRHPAGLQRIDVPLTEERRQKLGKLTIVWDSQIERRMKEIRAAALPNETGGALVGYFDMERLVVYITAALPAPPDSKSGPGFFIRGTAGLDEELKQLNRRTGGVALMVGDWHSHPYGVAAEPSFDDLELLVAEGLLMAHDGRPGLIAIISDEGVPTFCIGHLLEEAA